MPTGFKKHFLESGSNIITLQQGMLRYVCISVFAYNHADVVTVHEDTCVSGHGTHGSEDIKAIML